MEPKRAIANLYSSKYYRGKKIPKPCHEGPHLLIDRFMKVFYKTTTCPRQPLLLGPKSGHLIQIWLYYSYFNIQTKSVGRLIKQDDIII